MKKLTREEQWKQTVKESKAVFIFMLILAVYHCGTAFALEKFDIFVLGMPLWYVVSNLGAGILAIAGAIFLTTKVFIDFEYDTEKED